MKDWETRTFVRKPLKHAALDKMNDIHLPAELLMTSIEHSEVQRKTRFFASPEVRIPGGLELRVSPRPDVQRWHAESGANMLTLSHTIVWRGYVGHGKRDGFRGHEQADSCRVGVQGRLKLVKNNVVGVKHPSHGAGTIFGIPSAETHGLLSYPPCAASTSRLCGLYKSKQDRHSLAWEDFCKQRDQAQGILTEWVHNASCEACDVLQQTVAQIKRAMAMLSEDKIMTLDEASLHDVRCQYKFWDLCSCCANYDNIG
jgi:hypothetical protein